MPQFLHYFGRFQDLRGGVTGLPAWGRAILVLAAIPGTILVLLSLAAFVVSLLALLVLTVPAYRLVKLISAAGQTGQPGDFEVDPLPSSGRRRVDATIIE